MLKIGEYKAKLLLDYGLSFRNPAPDRSVARTEDPLRPYAGCEDDAACRGDRD